MINQKYNKNLRALNRRVLKKELGSWNNNLSSKPTFLLQAKQTWANLIKLSSL